MACHECYLVLQQGFSIQRTFAWFCNKGSPGFLQGLLQISQAWPAPNNRNKLKLYNAHGIHSPVFGIGPFDTGGDDAFVVDAAERRLAIGMIASSVNPCKIHVTDSVYNQYTFREACEVNNF